MMRQLFAESVSFTAESPTLKWYNELDPELLQKLKDVPDRYVSAFIEKYSRDEICDSRIDRAQLQLLRDERVAGIYLNSIPVATGAPSSPRLLRRPQQDELNPQVSPQVSPQASPERQSYAIQERVDLFHKSEAELRDMHTIYGIGPLKKAKLVMRGRGPKVEKPGDYCRRAKSMAPYNGPHGVNIRPVAAVQAPVKSKFYQISPGDLQAYNFPGAKSPKVNKYPTTVRAVWMEHRFHSPDGLDYRALQEQIRSARYKAMSHAVRKESSPKKAAILNSRLWSTHSPKSSTLHQHTGNGSSQQDEKSPGDVKETAEVEKSVFSVDEEYWDDLLSNTSQLRGDIAPIFNYQPYGLYARHRKDTRKFQECLKKDEKMRKFMRLPPISKPGKQKKPTRLPKVKTLPPIESIAHAPEVLLEDEIGSEYNDVIETDAHEVFEHNNNDIIKNDNHGVFKNDNIDDVQKADDLNDDNAFSEDKVVIDEDDDHKSKTEGL